MSFNIVMQRNSSEANRFDKELSTIGTLTGILKNQTSIINPNIVCEGDISTYSDCNYMTISEFGRSYFITNMVSVSNGIFIVEGHCDVISSFKSQILNNNAIIRRQENNWNLYLNDGSFKIYQNPNILTKEFPTGFNTQEFILAVAGS